MEFRLLVYNLFSHRLKNKNKKRSFERRKKLQDKRLLMKRLQHVELHGSTWNSWKMSA
jgi:hypothetical protein